jgi:pimeloyl-ACP methyl ester carboxylesterase
MMKQLQTRGSKHRRRFLWLGLLALVIVPPAILINSGCNEWIASGIVYAPNQGVTITANDEADEAELTRLDVDDQFRVDVGSPIASISVWIIEPRDDVQLRGTILLLHGSNSDKRAMLGPAGWFTRAGYRAVLVDLRGHGRSSGDHITFGIRESQDLCELLDQLGERRVLAGDVGIYGTSYGGAVGIQLAGRDDRVKAVVAVAPFSSMRDVVPNYLRIYVPMGFLISQSRAMKLIDRAGHIAQIDPDDANCVIALGHGSAQVLLIHGQADRKIKADHSRKLHESAPTRTKLIVVEKADHDSIMGDPDNIVSRSSVEWFDRWMTTPANWTFSIHKRKRTAVSGR